MDLTRVVALRELLEVTGWVERTRGFARAVRRAGHDEGGLLLVGTPQDEPWHLAAHLDDESRLAGVPELAPTLVRWAPPAGAPPHLAVGLHRLEQAGRGETVFVVAPQQAPAELLERVSDARQDGAVVLALDGGDPELESLAHEALTVPAATDDGLGSTPDLPLSARASGLVVPGPAVSFDLVTHLVSVAAGEPMTGLRGRGLRSRLARLLDAVSGTPEQG